MNLKQLLTNLNPFSKKEEKLKTPEITQPVEEPTIKPVIKPAIEPILEVKEPEVITEVENIEEVKGEVKEEPKAKNKESKDPNKALSLKMWTMSELDKQVVVSLWASGLTPSEVIERARLEHNIEVSVSQILKYSKAEKWQPLIRKVRETNFSDLASVAGSHKKVRLDRGEKIYDKAMGKGKLDVALKAVEHQRKEMEGDNSHVNLTLNQFNVLSDEELEHKKTQVLERIKLMSENKENKENKRSVA